ncbi:MAG: AAA family ATPase [Burkholderiales bacterium]|nr:AAA family ATPase [Burkholderiales bacterium]
MYTQRFGLTSEPFSIAPDPRFLYMSERHREALAHLLYGVTAGGGFVLLTGAVGAGKTTVCRCFLGQLPAGCEVAYVFNPKLSVTELLQTACHEFGIAVPEQGSVKRYVDPLNEHLLAAHAAGRHSVLVIDEAQNLAPEVLEQLRLLTNLETDTRKLLQIVLIGQPELREMLAAPGMEQLAQRVIARYHLEPLSGPETAAYVRHRLAVAGLQGPMPFDDALLRRIHRHTRGVPRRINLLCDRALLGAYAQGQSAVSAATLEQAAREVFGAAKDDSPHTGRLRAVPIAAAAAAGAVLALAAVLGWQAWGPGAGEGAAVDVAAPGASVAGRDASGAPAPGAAGATAAALPPGAGAQAAATPTAGAGSAVAAPAGEAADTIVPGATPAPAAVVASAPPGADPGVADGTVVPALDAAMLAGQAASLWSDPADAWRALAAVWPVDAGSGDPCVQLARAGVGCWQGKATLALVRQLDRPGWLTLQAAGGPRTIVLLTGLGDGAALLRGPDGAIRVSLATLATLWQGDFATLWRTPPGYTQGSVQPGGPLAGWLLEQLGAYQAGALPLDLPLRQRIEAFQRAQGLDPDGIAGALTLMQLARAAGADEPRLERVR